MTFPGEVVPEETERVRSRPSREIPEGSRLTLVGKREWSMLAYPIAILPIPYFEGRSALYGTLVVFAIAMALCAGFVAWQGIEHLALTIDRSRRRLVVTRPGLLGKRNRIVALSMVEGVRLSRVASTSEAAGWDWTAGIILSAGDLLVDRGWWSADGLAPEPLRALADRLSRALGVQVSHDPAPRGPAAEPAFPALERLRARLDDPWDPWMR